LNWVLTSFVATATAKLGFRGEAEGARRKTRQSRAKMTLKGHWSGNQFNASMGQLASSYRDLPHAATFRWDCSNFLTVVAV
jgi:hypothetical protein